MAKDNTTPKPADRDKKCAVLFELENLAVQGRQVVFDAVKSSLASKSVGLSPVEFARQFLDRPLKDAVLEILQAAGKTRVSEDKLISEIQEDIKKAVVKKSAKCSPTLLKVLKICEEKNLMVAAISSSDTDTGTKVGEALGLGDMDKSLLFCSDENEASPRANQWLRAAKNLSVPPSRCVVFATSTVSCKAALTAGTRCIVVPDDFTSHQDFSGADYILDSFDDSAVDALVAMTESLSPLHV